MITGERGQRAAAIMVGEVGRLETAEAVKVLWFGVEDAAESHLRQGEGVRGLK